MFLPISFSEMSIARQNLNLFFFHTPPISPFGLNEEEGEGIEHFLLMFTFYAKTTSFLSSLPLPQPCSSLAVFNGQ
jgi:hypothetical protein